ncbi:MAG: hypothetical protein KAY61_02010 [Candidatus Eisenbacteria bacterium]|jgi:hypothetical protein|nr:hypothetical protein [Candidatus Eisenbacteria bacterium]MBP8136952.1 hypothetical protein [Candidatus Eisenbacteria bacterium]
MIKNLRLWLPVTMLAALIASGCMLVSGQFIVPFKFIDVGADPVTVNSSTSLSGVAVDLNTVDVYADHKGDLKDVVDLALLGNLTNLDSGAGLTVEVWMVPTPGTMLTTDAAVRGATGAIKVWGPVTVAASGSKNIGWDESAALFTGRKQLIDEIKGDGRFDLYALGNNGYHFRITKGVLMAVISAGK